MSTPPANPRDLLLSRLMDGLATTDEMRRFAADARNHGGDLLDLLEMLRDQRHLHQALASQTESAGTDEPFPLPTRGPGRPKPLRRPWVAISGWASAAVLALLVLTTLPGGTVEPGAEALRPPQHASTGNGTDPDHLLSRYLRANHVLGDLDPLLVEAVRLPDGRLAMVYHRRIEEVAIVDPDVFGPEGMPQVDESGMLVDDPRIWSRGTTG